MTALDPLYVSARRTLLDVLDALAPHTNAVIVVGAHAVYIRTGNAGISVAPFTTDADFALNPSVLGENPSLQSLLEAAGFERDLRQPGAWLATTSRGESIAIPIDLMVPSASAPNPNKRSVALPGHDKMATRTASGLEAVLVDNDVLSVGALDPADTRSLQVRVAGPTGLMIAKLHKLHDRLALPDDRRLADKDAGDVYRLMQSTETELFIATTRNLLDNGLTAATTQNGLAYLGELFGARARPGVRMAVAALTPAVPSNQIEGVIAAFIRDVLDGDASPIT